MAVHLDRTAARSSRWNKTTDPVRTLTLAFHSLLSPSRAPLSRARKTAAEKIAPAAGRRSSATAPCCAVRLALPFPFLAPQLASRRAAAVRRRCASVADPFAGRACASRCARRRRTVLAAVQPFRRRAGEYSFPFPFSAIRVRVFLSFSFLFRNLCFAPRGVCSSSNPSACRCGLDREERARPRIGSASFPFVGGFFFSFFRFFSTRARSSEQKCSDTIVSH